MNISKALKTLSDDILAYENLADAKAHLLKVLDSYKYQTDVGIDKIESFINSIYTPSKKQKKSFDFDLSDKKRVCLRFEHIIKKLRTQNVSDLKIAVILNARYVHKKDYFNKMYINRFRKERGIN